MKTELSLFYKQLGLLIFFSLYSMISQAQEEYLIAKLTDSSIQKTSTAQTNNSILNQIFVNNQVYEYDILIAENYPGFENLYYFLLNGNINNLIRDLNNIGYFIDFEKEYVALPASCFECPDPPFVVNDPETNNNYAWDQINAFCAWDITSGNPDVNLAIIDEGVDISHDDLDGNISVFPIGQNCTGNHGTPGFGTIGAIANNNLCVTGIANDCTLNAFCTTNGVSIQNQILNAAMAGNRVINISFQQRRPNCDPNGNSTMRNAVETAIELGAFVVFSAGNFENEFSWCEATALDGCIQVASAERFIENGVEFNEIDHTTLPSQNTGTKNQFVDLSAPGRRVMVLREDPPNSCSLTLGPSSSTSAPFVSGIAGLMISEANCIEPEMIEAILKETVTPYITSNNLFPGRVGTGIVNAFNAVRGAGGDFDPISGGETRIWTQDHYLGCDLYVEDKSTLIIDGINVFIDEGVRIIVGDGSKLIIRNTIWNRGRLTNSSNYCLGEEDKLWGGIEVWGGGTVEISNSDIEHANTGIKVWHNAKVIADKAHFINNRKGVEFIGGGGARGYTSKSTFTKCDFYVNDEFLIPNLDAHISMWAVKGININGCKFSNNMSNAIEYINRGDGIRSLDASYSVDDYYIGIQEKDRRTIFERLYQGIDASNSSYMRTFSVKDTDFHENQFGMHISGVDGINVTGNEFKIGIANEDMISAGIFEGIRLIKCSGYTISHNDFLKCRQTIGVITPSGIKYNYCDNIGTNIIDSGEEPNLINGNYFEALKRGNRAIWQNRNEDFNYVGLQYLCNDFIGNERDISIELDMNYGNAQGVSIHQGDIIPESPAGNCFEESESNIINEVSPTIDYYHKGGICKIPEVVEMVKPVELAGGDESCHLVPGDPGDPDDPDDPNPCPEFEISCLRSNLIGIISEKETALSSLSNLIDNGNTQNMIISIQTNHAQEVINDIQNISPFLSIDATIELISQVGDRFTEGEVVTMLQQNPDVLNHSKVFDLIFKTGHWLPENISHLRNSMRNETPRTVLVTQISKLENEIINLRRYVLKELFKSEEVDHEEVDYWLRTDMRYRNEVKRIQHSFMHGNYAEGMSIISSINVDEYAEGPDQEEWISFVELKIIEREAEQEYENYKNMEESTRQILIAKAQNLTGYSGIHSANILNYFFNEDYRINDPSVSDSPQFRKSTMQVDKKNNESLIYPNPTKESVTINLQGFSEVVIHLINSNGQLIKSITQNDQELYFMKLDGLEKGIYYVSICPKGNKKIIEKLIVL